MADFTLHDLEEIIASRATESPDTSYTAKLLAGGVEKPAKKLGEEAVEAVIAAVSHDREELVSEMADLFYHALVVMKAENVPLDDVLEKLQGRTAQSGIEEKASRKGS